ncbi:MAG: TlyA family RNA methyltransferase [Clostridia bacterium]|nr:TlyA family RNA methyltransferase [Clostridia bacterium]
MRIDILMVESGLAVSRAKAKEMILSGAVLCDGRQVTKASLDVSDAARISVTENPLQRYVGRGGLKLEAALDAFAVSVDGLVAIDVGASSGGFTDCLLQRGASFVYAVDSGSGQLHPKLASDARVRVMEGCNARYLEAEDFDPIPTLAVMDVSFISQTLLYPALRRVMRDGGEFLSLIKPQFELDRASLGKGGIVKEEKLRKRAVDRVVREAEACGLALRKIIKSPITGGDGNTEYLAEFSVPPITTEEENYE